MSGSATCVSCGHGPVERYCGRCGQRVHARPFRLRPLLRQAADDAFNLDHGLTHTVVALSRRPGGMVRDYVSGRTRPYTNPVRYLLLCAAIGTFLSLSSGFVDTQIEQITADADRLPEATVRTFEFLTRYFNLLLVAGTPLLAALSRIFFASAGRTYTEHLIFNLYVYAQQNLIFVLVLPLFFLTGDAILFGNLYLLLIGSYYVWACHGFFGIGRLGAAVRGGTVLVVFMAAFWLVMSLVGVALTTLPRG